jgi:lipoprotein NlpI
MYSGKMIDIKNMRRFSIVLLLLVGMAGYGFADAFTDELQWLAKLAACIGQYNSAQTGDYTVKDPQDYYKPSDIRVWLARQSGNRTVTQTFYGICFDYAQWAYNYIIENQNQILGAGIKDWYIVGTDTNFHQITLYDTTTQNQATVIVNGVYVKKIAMRNVRAHGDAKNHAWLWVYGNDDTIYWIDPTWTDNTGYVWWGVVRNGEEVQTRPSADYCMVVLPNNAAFVDFNQGNTNKIQGNWDRAIADYTAALRSDHDNAATYISRGNAYYNKNDYDRAIADYTQAIRLNPNYSIAYQNRGVAYYNKGDYDQAIVDYTEAIRLDSNNAIRYSDRAVAYYNKGDYDRAIADYQSALRLNPNHVNAKNDLELARKARGY